MRNRRPAMTLIEMVFCLAILSLCCLALTRGMSNLSLLALREEEDNSLVPAVEQLLMELESVPPEVVSGTLEAGWQYETTLTENGYVLTVWRTDRDERHQFVIREKGA